MVKTSLNLDKTLFSAHAHFKIAKTIEDCQFPNSKNYDHTSTIDYTYMGPIIAIGIFIVLFAIVIGCCYRQVILNVGIGFFWK